MEDVIRTRLKLIYESVQLYMNSAQCALKELTDSEASYKALELTGSKLKGANHRLVSEIRNYCTLIKEPNVDEISQLTSIQIQTEDLLSEIDVSIIQNNRNRATLPTSNENINIRY